MTNPHTPIRHLRSAVAGVVGPGDDGWDLARRAWNLAVDQRPAAVVHAADAGDVAAVLDATRSSGLRVAPQGTGHGASALGALDDVVLLKTDRMSSFEIDPVARRARVGAGTLWGDVAVRAGEHGLAALHGSSIDVGVVGSTLSGGIGWLSRLHGVASDRVTAVELVTADGELRRVAGDDELFWALRGGGGGFGVVTAMEFELLALAEVYAGGLYWPVEVASDVLHAYREWAPTLPDEMTSIIRLMHLPDVPGVPEPLRDVPVIDLGAAFVGDAAAGAELIRPLRDVAPPLIDTFATIPAADLRRLHGDPEQPVASLGHHTVLRELTAEAADVLLALAGEGSGSPLLSVELRQLGGALGRPRPGAGALGAIDGEYVLYAVGPPTTPDLARAVDAQLDAIVERLAPWRTGTSYVNFSNRPIADMASAFQPGVHERLRAVKAAVDPHDLFVANHPIEAARRAP
jgi:FAD/FMN-containing dehydrogenase